MADKQIVELPANSGITDETLFPAYQPGATEPAQKVTGAQIAKFAEEAGAEAGKAAAGEVERGATFTPHFDESTGMLSWTNDLGLPNPDPMQLSGVTAFNGRFGEVLPKSGDYTADMVGGVAVKGTWTTYSRIELLGLTDATATMEGIINALPNYSDITVAVSTAWTSADVPTKYGTLHVVKIYAGRAYAKFEEAGGTHFGTFNGDNVFSGWTKLATTDYAVNKAGDTMTGSLLIAGNYIDVSVKDQTTSRFARMAAYPSKVGSFDYGADANNYRGIRFFSDNGIATALKLVDYINGAKEEYNLFHTGNRPSGSYTGNGDATARTIDISSVASPVAGAIVIASVIGFAIVTGVGGILSGTSLSNVAFNEAHFYNTGLNLATSNALLNGSGVTYYYQVL